MLRLLRRTTTATKSTQKVLPFTIALQPSLSNKYSNRHHNRVLSLPPLLSSSITTSLGNSNHYRHLEATQRWYAQEKKKKNTTKKNIDNDRSTASIEDLYQRKSPIEHVLLRPDTYVGSLERTHLTTWIYNRKLHCMQRKEIEIIPALFKIFDEILVNASDNKQRDNNTSEIRVNINVKDNVISVFNNGKGIPVKIHKKEKLYVPELVFGNLLTSSNFDDSISKVTGGRNGYGAKLTNIFSKTFTISTVDSANRSKYTQTWRNNMSEREEPVIKEVDPSEQDYTQVTFSPDLQKFGIKSLNTTDTIDLFIRRVVDIAACCPDVSVYLNDELISVHSFRDYINLFAQESESQEKKIVCVKINNRWEIGVSLSSTSQFEQVSFVNGIFTSRGGTHVMYIADQITNFVKARITALHKDLSAIPTSLIKNHIFVFVRCLIENPAFDSQVKETLTTQPTQFGSTCELPKKFLKEIEEETEIIDRVVEYQKLKERSKLNVSKKAKGKLSVEKLDDAPLAGTAQSQQCTLILTEGDSAKSLAVAGLSVVGREKYGVFPLKGKLLNVNNATMSQLVNNSELNNIKKILGLNHDHDYENGSQNLRYGKVMLMTDQDHDGSHIKGLFINFIHHYWPNLVKKSNFLEEFVTPIMKAFKGSSSIAFFSIPQYEAWRDKIIQDVGPQELSKWRIKYYKGLGTSTSTEAKEYFSNLQVHKKKLIWSSDDDKEYLSLAFGKTPEALQRRKEWLKEGSYPKAEMALIDNSRPSRTIKEFIKTEMYLYSMADNVRSIPSVVDGLKPSQRKVIYACLKRRLLEEVKVTQLSGYVSEQTAYHHGEASLQATIVHLAQDFVGANNLNYLKPIGQFGTRLQGGQDAASARYIYTTLSPYTRLLFHEDDDPILQYLHEDGQKIEPYYYVPIIPTILVNGCQGIGAGWSTFVPNYNPISIIDNVIRHINNEPMHDLSPWWKGFKGKIVQVDKQSFIIYGVLQKMGDRNIKVTELPVGKWTSDYKGFLDELRDEKYIKSYEEYHTDESVCFDIVFTFDPFSFDFIHDCRESIGDLDEEYLLQKLKLFHSVRLSNMHLFSANGEIKKYEDPLEIIRDFAEVRAEYYIKRKEHLEKIMTQQLEVLTNSHKFYQLIIDKKLVLINKKKETLISELKQHGLKEFNGSYDYLLNSSLWNLTEESITKLLVQCSAKSKELSVLKSKTPSDLWKEDLIKARAVLINELEPKKITQKTKKMK